EAAYVKALAERSLGKFDDARMTLTELLKDAAGVPEELKKVAKADLKQITEPMAFFVPAALKARNENRPAEALSLIDTALQIFPADKYAKENAALLAVKVVLDVDQMAVPAEQRLAFLEGAGKAAADAVAAGQTIEGNYALGKVFEAKGDLVK